MVPITYTARGYVPRGAAADALRRIERLLSDVPGQVLHATVTLASGEDPAPQRSARIGVGAVVNGVPVRARVASRGFPEAIDLTVDRRHPGPRHQVTGTGVVVVRQ